MQNKGFLVRVVTGNKTFYKIPFFLNSIFNNILLFVRKYESLKRKHEHWATANNSKIFSLFKWGGNIYDSAVQMFFQWAAHPCFHQKGGISTKPSPLLFCHHCHLHLSRRQWFMLPNRTDWYSWHLIHFNSIDDEAFPSCLFCFVSLRL